MALSQTNFSLWHRRAASGPRQRMTFTAPRLRACEDRTAPSGVPPRHELVVIDSLVADAAILAADLFMQAEAGLQFDVVVLTPGGDGLGQVSDAIGRTRRLDAIHFVTHGNARGFQLGSTPIDPETLAGRAGEVSGWARALSPGADLLVYGCDVAAGEDGRSLLNKLRSLTGADVAASTNRTGAGGDWRFEFTDGAVESTVAFSPQLRATYSGSFALFVVSSSADVGAGTFRTALTLANNTIGADTITFSKGMLIRPTSALPAVTETLVIDATVTPGYSGTPLVELRGDMVSTSNGLVLQAPTTVRGLAIVAFDEHGILVSGAAAGGSVIQACFIGTADGTTDARNQRYGLHITNAPNVLIGGSTAGLGNLIVANNQGGIWATGSQTKGLTVQGNWIGVTRTASPLGNNGDGLLLNSGVSNATIGGTAAGAGNVIAFNNGDGILLVGSTTDHVAILGNAIHDNNETGIDLEDDGPTPNDPLDGDTNGANALKNSPVVSIVLTDGSRVTISGSYHGIQDLGYRLEFFASPAADGSGFGEGARYLGFVDIVTDAKGDATFALTATAAVKVGEAVAATATDASNRSSEFCKAVKAGALPVIVTPAGTATSEAGLTTTFSVQLTVAPTADVLIPVAVSDPTEGSVGVTTLTFTPLSWNKAQTVVVIGVDDLIADGDQSYTVVLGKMSSTDGRFNGLDAPDVNVINIDDEVPGFVVGPTSGLKTTEAGASATFRVRLANQPVADVTITVTVSDPAEGQVSVSTLTFNAGNWSTDQTVTVTGRDDFVDDGDRSFTVVLGPASSPGNAYDGIDPADIIVTNVDDDMAGFVVTPTAGLVTTEAGGAATFTVRLTSQSTADVVVSVGTLQPGEALPNVSSLTFTAANWNLTQTITITGVDDLADDGDQPFTIILGSAVSADGKYDGLDPADALGVNQDDDNAGFVVTPLGGLVTTEAGGQASFTVRLTSQPARTVTVDVTVSDPAEASANVSTLTFTPSNWKNPQTVTVTGLDDSVDDGDRPFTVVLSPAKTTDGKYAGIDPPDVAVTNRDDDTAGFVVTPIAGLIVTEAGGTADFTVTLTSRPTADVTVNIATSDATEGTLSVTVLTFIAANWNVARTVTVVGVDDFTDDGDRAFTIVLSPAASGDGKYAGLDPADVSVTNADDDTAGFLVSPRTGLITTEGGGTAAFTVALTSRPTADVTVTLGVTNPAEVSLAVTVLTFTAKNWNTLQIVTVTGQNDFVDDGDQPVTILLNPAASADAKYDGLNPADVTVTNADDDTAGFVITPAAGLITTESGGSASFRVNLSSQPTAAVTVALTVSDPAEGRLALVAVTFTAANWNVAQRVAVSGVDDFVNDGDRGYSIVTSSAISGDGKYNGLDPADVSLVNLDDDTAGVRVTPTAGLVTTEAGNTATFTVALNSQPTANVVIGLSVDDPTESRLSAVSLVFTPQNWKSAQTVTVTGVNDATDDGDRAFLVIVGPVTGSDSKYAGLNPAEVTGTNLDDDTAGFVVTPLGGLVTSEAGAAASFAVRLNSRPTSSVIVGLQVSAPGEASLAVSTLTFTAANWDTPQFVVVTGLNDFVDDGDRPFTVVLGAAGSSDRKYAGLDPADVAAVNIDDDAAGIVMTSVVTLVTTESGGGASFTAVLTSQPVAPVSFAVTSSNALEGVPTVVHVTFTAADWDRPQIITVRGTDDPDDDGDQPYTIVFGPAASGDGKYSGLMVAPIAAVNRDDDTAALVVTSPGPLVVTEAGTAAAFTLVLASRPGAPVFVAVISADGTEAVVANAGVTFTAANWYIPQTVVLTGADDFLDDGDVAFRVTIAPAVSVDPLYAGLGVPDLPAVNLDDDTSGFRVFPGSTVTVLGNSVEQVRVVLLSEPFAPVVLRLVSTDPAEVTVEPVAVTISPADWSVPRLVRLRGVSPLSDGRTVPAGVVFTASGEPQYDGLAASLPVRVVHPRGLTGEPSDPLITAAQPVLTIGSPPVANGWLVDQVLEVTRAGVVVFTAPVLQLPRRSGSTDGESMSDDLAASAAHASRPSASAVATRPDTNAAKVVEAPVALEVLPLTDAGPAREAYRFLADAGRRLGQDLQMATGRRAALARVTIGGTAFASAGLVLWSLRGAALLGSAMAGSSSAWSELDPLVLLKNREDDEPEDDSLADLAESTVDPEVPVP